MLTSRSQEHRLSVALGEVLTSSEEPGIVAQGLGKMPLTPQTPGWHRGIPHLFGLMAVPTLPSPATEPGCFPMPSPGPTALRGPPALHAWAGRVAGEMLGDTGGEEEHAAA